MKLIFFCFNCLITDYGYQQTGANSSYQQTNTNTGYQQTGTYGSYPQATQHAPNATSYPSYSVPTSGSATSVYSNQTQLSVPSATYSYSAGQTATAYAAPPNPPVPTYTAYQPAVASGAGATSAAPPPPPVAGSDMTQYSARPPPPPPPPNQQNVSALHRVKK